MAEERNILEREVLEVIREKYTAIFPAERRAADMVLQNPQQVINFNVSDLAKASKVSDATIVRMCHHLGYEGYYQFRIALARDLGKKKAGTLSTEVPDNVIGKMFEEFAEAMIAIGQQMDEQTIRACVDLIKNAGTVHVISMGNTTNIARYMGFRLERLGIRSTYSELPEYYINHINLSGEGDVVAAITQSGTSKRVLDGLKLAKDNGLKIIVITANIQSPAAKLADYVLNSSGQHDSLTMYKGYSYLNELAIVDALLNFTVNEELIAVRRSNRPELLLAENKL